MTAYPLAAAHPLAAALRPALVLIGLATVLTGLALPLGFSGAATLLAPNSAGGSLITRNGTIIGSALLGQNFTAAKYVHGRPSATTATDPADSSKTVAAPYNASNSSGSNLGPTSKALLDRVHTDVAALGGGTVPGDAVTSSASGLDPDISPENAERQVARIAAARRLPPDAIRAVLAAHTQGRLLGLIGEPHVDVLATNLALDASAVR